MFSFPIYLQEHHFVKVHQFQQGPMQSVELCFSDHAPMKLIERTCARLRLEYQKSRTWRIVREDKRTIIIQQVFPRQFAKPKVH